MASRLTCQAQGGKGTAGCLRGVLLGPSRPPSTPGGANSQQNPARLTSVPPTNGLRPERRQETAPRSPAPGAPSPGTHHPADGPADSVGFKLAVEPACHLVNLLNGNDGHETRTHTPLALRRGVGSRQRQAGLDPAPSTSGASDPGTGRPAGGLTSATFIWMDAWSLAPMMRLLAELWGERSERGGGRRRDGRAGTMGRRGGHAHHFRGTYRSTNSPASFCMSRTNLRDPARRREDGPCPRPRAPGPRARPEPLKSRRPAAWPT